MPTSAPKDYNVDEVAMWLNCIGLADTAPAFKENAVDGDMLVTLTTEDLTGDLGLSGLQAKKMLNNLEFQMELAASSGDEGLGPEVEALKKENEALKQENAALKAKLAPPAAAPAAPAPAPAAPPAKKAPPKNQHEVVKGAAGGALKGATMGAVAGAICGDPTKGAKMGAAAGATGGAMKGMGARRRRRMMG